MPELNDLKPLATLALDAALVFLWKPPTSVSKGGDVPEGLVPPGYSLPGLDDLPSVLAFAALAALMIAIVGSRNSPSIAPWLVKPRACGLLAMQFVIQIVHHANATCITQELKSPGWSAIGRMNHHLMDGFCHTSFTLVACFLYRNAAGKTERPTKLFLLLWIGMCMAGQQWETGGQSYRLKYHQPELFERHESTLRGALEQTFAPQYDIINPKSPGGHIYWSYVVRELLAFATLAGVDGLWHSKKALVAQVVITLLFVFNTAGNELFAGATVTGARSYSMHIAHVANYLCWQTGFWMWLCEKKEDMNKTSRRGTMETVDSISSGKED